MIEVRQTREFARWLHTLRDRRAREKIAIRLARIEATGNLGDYKRIDEIAELRIAYGPGYRLYFTFRGDVLIILLCGGDKKSQQRDIRRAIKIAEELDL